MKSNKTTLKTKKITTNNLKSNKNNKTIMSLDKKARKNGCGMR